MGASWSTTSLKKILTKEQLQLLGSLTGQIQGQIGQGIDDVGPDQVPGLSGLQDKFISMAESIGMAGGPEEQRNSSIMNLLSGEPATKIDPAAREKVYKAEEASLLGDLQRDVLPMLEERANARGGARSGALNRSYGRAVTALGEKFNARRSELEYRDEEARRGFSESAANRRLPAIGAFNSSRGQDLAAVGGAGMLQRDVQGQLQQEAYRKWYAAQPYANPWLGFLGASLGTQSRTPVTNTIDAGVGPS